MTATKLKNSGDVYHFEYEENKDFKILETDEEPERRFITAMDALALQALRLFDLSGISCKLLSVDWKDGEKAGSKVSLIAEEKSPYGKIKILLPKVSSQNAETPEEGVYDPENIKNEYNKAVDAMRAEAVRYLNGERRQKSLQFPEQEGKPRKGIIGAVADKAKGLFT
ncbi:MAG: hypothetical protein LBH35_00975 [Treponema sp.]|jgi:hypothetical protein|nr:hypothetical protein [Treponema sp.]